MVVSNPGKAKRRRFSPAQRRAQALFTKRAKSGAFRRKNTKRTSMDYAKSDGPLKWAPARFLRGRAKGLYGPSAGGTSGKISFGPKTYGPSSILKGSRGRRMLIKASASRYRKNTKLSASKFAQAGGRGKITSTIKRKYHAAKIGWRKNSTTKRSTMAFRRRNRFAKGKKSAKARRIAKKFWRSRFGRAVSKHRKTGVSMKTAVRRARAEVGGTSKRKVRRSSPKKPRKSTKRSRAARLAWARRKAGFARGEGSPMFRANPKRRHKARKSRRRSRRRSAVARRRTSYRRRRRNPIFGFLSPKRRARRSNKRRHSKRSRRSGRFTSRRTNPGMWLLKPAAFGLAGLAGTRVIPRLLAGFFPNVAGALGGAGGLLLSIGALFAIGFATRKVRFLSPQATPIMVGAGIGVLSEVIQRFAPPEWVAAIGLTPGGSAPMLPPSEDGTAGYVPEGLSAYVPEALGAYVRDRGLGLEVSEALGGYSGDCVGCTHPREATGPIGALSGGIFTGDTYSRSIF